MRTIAVVATLLALLTMSAFAFSADWVFLGADSRGALWHIDRESIIHERDTVTVWKRIEFREPYPYFQNDSLLKRALVMGAIDCAKQHTSIKAFRFFDAKDSIIASQESGTLDVSWPPSAQVPMLLSVMALVCRSPTPD